MQKVHKPSICGLGSQALFLDALYIAYPQEMLVSAYTISLTIYVKEQAELCPGFNE